MRPRSVPATVLVVEDDPVVLRVVSGILARTGYRVVQAASVAEALREARRSPDVCLLDLCLPDGNGLELAATLNACYPDIPLILMTGSAELLRDHSERDRFVQILVKPPDVRAIRQAIATALDNQPAPAGNA